MNILLTMSLTQFIIKNRKGHYERKPQCPNGIPDGNLVLPMIEFTFEAVFLQGKTIPEQLGGKL